MDRNPDGTTRKVPADMSFAEWKASFVKDDTKGGSTPATVTKTPSRDYSGKFGTKFGKKHYTAPPTAQAPANSTGTIFRVRKTWADAVSQIGTFSDLDNAKEFADKYPGYTVIDETGAAVYPDADKDGHDETQEEITALKAQIAAARKALE